MLAEWGRAKGVGGDRERAVWPHRIEGVEEQVHEGLLQLVIIAMHESGEARKERFNETSPAFQLGLNEPQRMVENFVQADLAEGGPGRTRRT